MAKIKLTKFIFASLVATVSTISCAESVRATGYGITEQDAIRSALITAAEQSRSIVVSESQARDGRLLRSDIIKYASSFVEDYTVVSKRHDGNRFIVEADVRLKDSRLAERLDNRKSRGSQIDGAAVANVVDNYVGVQSGAKTNGLRILNNVLNDYPLRALNVTVTKTDVQIVPKGVLFNVFYRLDWSEKYLDALAEVLNTMNVESKRNYCGECYVSIGHKYWAGFNKKYEFPDHQIVRLVFDKYSRDIHVKFNLVSSGGSTVYSTCRTGSLMLNDPLKVEIGPAVTSALRAEIPYDSNLSRALRQTTNVNAELVERCTE